MDVVRKARSAYARGLGMRHWAMRGKPKLKVGHGGTLDPLATGVVVVCFGSATRLVERLMGLTKVYLAEVDLSAFTATDDREGELEPVEVAQPPDEAALGPVLNRFTGTFEQFPPAFSAVHIEGRRAYELAREGLPVATKPKQVRVDRIEMLQYAWPMLSIRVHCGRGTYIRSLARDIGSSLGTGGHLASLRREAVGPFTLEQAVGGVRLNSPIRPEHLMGSDVLSGEGVNDEARTEG